MSTKIIIPIIVVFMILTGCAASQKVSLGEDVHLSKIESAALVPQEGNSPEMDKYIQQQLMDYGIKIKNSLPPKTTRSNDVDLIVEYTDGWRWDIVMYLQSLNINIYDGPSGKLIVAGNWENAVFHSFSKPQEVIKKLLDDMYAKLPLSR